MTLWAAANPVVGPVLRDQPMESEIVSTPLESVLPESPETELPETETPALSDEPEITEPPTSTQPPRKMGDVDGNGYVDARDFIMLRDFLWGLLELEGEDYLAADANEDGIVDAFDGVAIWNLIFSDFVRPVKIIGPAPALSAKWYVPKNAVPGTEIECLLSLSDLEEAEIQACKLIVPLDASIVENATVGRYDATFNTLELSTWLPSDISNLFKIRLTVKKNVKPGDIQMLCTDKCQLVTQDAEYNRKIRTIDGPSVQVGIWGDLNGDGEINIADILLARDFIFGTLATTYEEWAADLNEDGMISILDILLMRDIIFDL